MKYEFSNKFIKSYHSFPKSTQEKFDKQLAYLLKNIRHPSLHTKKYYESENIWQARVDKNIRFWFVINNDIYSIIDIDNHPK